MCPERLPKINLRSTTLDSAHAEELIHPVEPSAQLAMGETILVPSVPSCSAKTDQHGSAKTDEQGSAKTHEHSSAKTNEHANEHGSAKTDEQGSAKTDQHGSTKTNRHGSAKTDEQVSAKTNEHGSAETDEQGSEAALWHADSATPPHHSKTKTVSLVGIAAASSMLVTLLAVIPLIVAMAERIFSTPRPPPTASTEGLCRSECI